MTKEIKQRIETIKSGKVPDGYIKNNVGIFPNDWVTNKTLGDIGVFGKGKGIPGNMLGTGDIPCVGYGDIYMKYNHFHFEEALSFVDKETAKESTPIQKGTLLFTVTGETAEEIGKCICYNGDETIYVGGDIITFSSKNVNPIFIAYQQYQNFSIKRKARFGQGHSVVHIQKNNLEKLPVIYPNSDTEQQKITDILLKWDKIMQLQEKLIEKLELQKKALMQRLLKPKKDWKKVKIGTLTKELSIRNCHVRCHNIKSISNKNGFIDQEEQFSKRVASLDLSNYKKVTTGNIAYNPSRINVGSIAIYEDQEDGVISPMYVVLECKYINPHLFLLLLNSAKTQYDIRTYLAGSVRNSLNYSDLEKIKIFIPTEDEQNKLVNFFDQFEQLYTMEKNKFKFLKQQRKAMQQLLLTGIIRV